MLTRLLAIPAAQQCMLCLIKPRPMSQMTCSSNTHFMHNGISAVFQASLGLYSRPLKTNPHPMFPILQCVLWTSHFVVYPFHHWEQAFSSHFLRKALKDWSLRSTLHSADNAHRITAELSRCERRKVNDHRAPSQCIMSVPLLSIPTGCYSLTNSCPHTLTQPWHSHMCASVCILACIRHIILGGKPSLNQQEGLFHIL